MPEPCYQHAPAHREETPMPRQYTPRIECVCQQCGTPFTAQPSLIRKGGGKYCSALCRQQGARRPLEERFWEKVDKNGPIPAHRPELGPCWLWTGSKDRYGKFSPGGHSPVPLNAHRVSYELAYGPVPDGKQICHECDNPPCVNPSHLFAGTADENMKNMRTKGRDRHASGEEAGKSRLTWEQVREIRRRHAVGDVSMRALAREYNIAYPAIAYIVHNKTGREEATC